MGRANNIVSTAETAAVYLHVFGGLNDWRRLYAIGAGITDEAAILNINNTVVYRWKNAPKIQTLIADITRRKYDLERAGYERGTAETLDKINGPGDSVRAETETTKRGAGFIDYSRPENQTTKLNELVNTARDPDAALDALKVIMQAQKADRDAAKEGRVVRAYLPIVCESCPLYETARKKRGNGL